jgi:uncharacterized damage-inducible protein DinB
MQKKSEIYMLYNAHLTLASKIEPSNADHRDMHEEPSRLCWHLFADREFHMGDIFILRSLRDMSDMSCALGFSLQNP